MIETNRKKEDRHRKVDRFLHLDLSNHVLCVGRWPLASAYKEIFLRIYLLFGVCVSHVFRCPCRSQGFPKNQGKPVQLPGTESRMRNLALENTELDGALWPDLLCQLALRAWHLRRFWFLPAPISTSPLLVFSCVVMGASRPAADMHVQALGSRPLPWMRVPLVITVCRVLCFLKLPWRELLQAQLNFISTALEMKHSFQKLPTIHF